MSTRTILQLTARYVMFAVILLLVFTFVVEPVYGVEAAPEGPCMGKCLLNFAAFFIVPVLLAAVMVYAEFRYRHRPGSPDQHH